MFAPISSVSGGEGIPKPFRFILSPTVHFFNNV